MSDRAFKDHFSQASHDYSRYRPSYPPELIEYVASCAPARHLAVDCATGNGQAAVALAEHFESVLAVDASATQLGLARPHPRVRYERAMAESLPVADHSVALVAAAQAVHWFDFDRFYAECRRVLVPGGIVAVWTYERFHVSSAIDPVVERFYYGTLGPYWPPERQYVEDRYRTLPFPWAELVPPEFTMQADWSLDQLLGYIGSWSAITQYRQACDGADPLPALRAELETLWPASSTLRLSWPIHLRLGRTDPL